jgi:hypothetical protein
VSASEELDEIAASFGFLVVRVMEVNVCLKLFKTNKLRDRLYQVVVRKFVASFPAELLQNSRVQKS